MAEEKRIIEGLETIVDVFTALSKSINMKFYDVDKDGKVNRWNADIIPTSNPETFYLTQYEESSHYKNYPNSRDFSHSLLYRVNNDNVQCLYSVHRFLPTRVVEKLVVQLLRKSFNKHENEREMKTFPLSIGETTFGVFGSELGDAFEKSLSNTGSLYAMKKYQVSGGNEAVGKDVKKKFSTGNYAGQCGMWIGLCAGEDIRFNGPPGFR